MLAKEAERRCFGAVQAVPEVHLVQVHLEDLVLRELLFEAPRQHRLFQLSYECLVGGKEAPTRELLRQRATALRGATGADVAHRRRDDADNVDAAMIVEALVLDRDDRVHEVRRHRRQRRIDPALLEDRERRTVAGVVQRGPLRHRSDRAQLRRGRGRRHRPQSGDDGERDDRPGRRHRSMAKAEERHVPRHVPPSRVLDATAAPTVYSHPAAPDAYAIPCFFRR